jgi:UDPglucose 6-dehydrogenase
MEMDTIIAPPVRQLSQKPTSMPGGPRRRDTLEKRIGAKFLHAGPGYGGSCFPKDTLALIKTGQDEGAALRIVETVVAVNDARKRAMARKVIHALGGSVRGKKIALLGLAFKPNTDDMRDAPSLAIVASLAGDGAQVHAYDPESMAQARPLMPEVTFHDNAYSALEGADTRSPSSPSGTPSARSISTGSGAS